MKPWSMLFFLLALPGQEGGGPPTFSRNVAPILFHHCAICHRPGEIGPFSLLNYSDVRKRSQQILGVLESRRMPPWKPEPGYGEFLHERRLPDSEIALIKKWVEQGSIEGDPKDLPPVPQVSGEWEFGKPDLVVQMPEAYTVPAEVRDTYRAFVIPLNLTEDKHIRAFQFRPSNRRSVHHALIYLDGNKTFKGQPGADSGAGFPIEAMGVSFFAGGLLGSWAPGGETPQFGEGRAALLKKNDELVLHIHFNSTGKIEKEQSSLGIWFSKEPPKQRVNAVVQNDLQIFLPAGVKSILYTGTTKVPVDVDIVGVAPHAHYLAKECRIFATTPEGREIPLIWIKNWDFDWQMEYRFKEAVRVPKGSEVTTRWIYDNSTANPRNPSNPPQDVQFGYRSTDEMALTIFRVVPERPEDVLKLNVALRIIKHR